MRRLIVVLAAVLQLGGAALAQALAPSDIIGAAVGDWNGDGRPDLALLAVTDADSGTVGILIYLREEDDDGLLELSLYAPDQVWGSVGDSRIFGQEPAIHALDNGSIAVTEQNLAIGRDRWQATRTIAWRDGRFVVAGFTFSSYDTLQEEEPLDCDLNLLTGRGLVNGRPVTFPRAAIALQDWVSEAGDDPGRRICRAP